MKVQDFVGVVTENYLEIREDDELLALGSVEEIAEKHKELLDCSIEALDIEPNDGGTFVIALHDGQTKRPFVRIRKTDTLIVFESIQRTEDHTDNEEWGVISMLSEKQLNSLPQEKIDELVQQMEAEKAYWIKEGLYQEYPF